MIRTQSQRWMTVIASLAIVACGDEGGGNESVACSGADGTICTFAGSGSAALGRDGVSPLDVSFYLPQDVTWGPDGRPYIVDWNNHRIRTITEDGLVETVIGTGELGDAPEGPALSTRLNHPTHVSFTPSGELVLSAWHNSKVMAMDMAVRELDVLCGLSGKRSYAGEDVPAREAILDLPVATASDSTGRLYIMDQGNQRIRRIEIDGAINTVVGPVGPYEIDGYIEVCDPPPGEFQAPDCRFCLEAEASDPDCKGPPARPQGFAGEGEDGSLAFMNQPFSQSAPPAGRMEMGPGDVLYFTDSGNHLIRALNSDGTVVTVAGTTPPPYDPTELATKTPAGGYAGDGGPATEALFNSPRDLAVASDGTLYIADTLNSCVRRVGTDGIVSTVAGVCGERGFSGDNGPADEALLNRPYGVALDDNGDLYIIDTYNQRIRVVFMGGAS